MAHQPKVLTAGVAVMDFIFRVDLMPRTAEKYRANEAYTSGGGNAANAAVAIARLGGEALLAARIGDDPIGAMILQELQAQGVDTRLVHSAKDGKSSFSSIYVDGQGERQIMNFRGSGLPMEADWLETPGEIDVVLADNRWPPLTRRAVEIARQHNVPAIIDVEAPVEETNLAGATHLAFSAQGLAEFGSGLSVQDALEKARDISGAWVCVTDGENGVRTLDENGFGQVPATPVTAVETLGAGDVWHGAFALFLAEGKTEFEAMQFANCAAGIKCTRTGGRASYPDRKCVSEKLSEYLR